MTMVVEDGKGCEMVWTYCSACGLRTEWTASCSECGAANLLYRPSPSPPAASETKPAEMVNASAKCNVPWQLWGYSAAFLLMFCLSLAVMLVVPPLFW